MRIVFMGTPDFAVPSLKTLYENGYEIAGVITAPDKPAGRGLQMKTSPVKDFATQNNLKVLQPTNLKNENFVKELTGGCSIQNAARSGMANTFTRNF